MIVNSLFGLYQTTHVHTVIGNKRYKRSMKILQCFPLVAYIPWGGEVTEALTCPAAHPQQVNG